MSYKWVTLTITTIGVLMVAIDGTVLVLALPDIMKELHANLVSMVWVLMAYIFASTVLLLALGRVADLYGRVRLYNLGFVTFTIGSVLCGFSQTSWELIGSRVIQGSGGALMVVNSLAILTEAFPPYERGTALGVNSMTFGIGGVVGPVLGGFILSITSWRWIFFINVPIGIAGSYFGYRYLRELSAPQRGEHLDPIGFALFGLSLFALLFALTTGVEIGWTSPGILALFVVALAGTVAFVFWERRSDFPGLDLRLFRSWTYDFAVISATLQSLAVFAVQFLIVFYFQAVRGYDPLRAALLLLPMPIASGTIGPISGRISDRIGARIPATAGLLAQVAGIYWLSTIDPRTPYLPIAAGLALTGVGAGLFYSPNTSSAMSAAHRARLGVASATLATLRNTGMVTSFALTLAVAASAVPREEMLQVFIGTAAHFGTGVMVAFVGGMRAALRVSAIICLAAAVMSSVRGTGDARRQEERAAA